MISKILNIINQIEQIIANSKYTHINALKGSEFLVR